MPNPKLLIATHNQGKIREYRHLLQDIPLDLVSLDDLGISEEIEETGATFVENAWLKACGYAQLAGMLTLSDDSGLEVDALGGEPGIHSARYGGDSCASDEDRIQLLLRNLAEVPREKRTARFRCVIAICSREGRMASVVGSVIQCFTFPLTLRPCPKSPWRPRTASATVPTPPEKRLRY